METCDLATALKRGAGPTGLDPLARVLERIAAQTFECALDETAPAGEAFQAIALSCLCRFRRNYDLLVQRGDAQALHQARVALRQLRSALSIFRPICEDERFGLLSGELRWLAATMNDARDLDTLIARIGDPPPALIVARRQACARALKALASARARSLERELIDWLADGVWLEVRNPGDQAASAFASTALERLHRKLRKRGRHLRALDDEGLHRVRIAAKKLRYATGFFAGLFPGAKAERREKRFGKAVRALQDELGELRDVALAPGALERRHVPRAAWPDLPEREVLLERAAAAFAQVSERKPYWR